MIRAHISAANLQPFRGCGVMQLGYLEIDHAWTICPLGPQCFACYDGFVDDCNGGVVESIVLNRWSVLASCLRSTAAGAMRNVRRLLF